MSKSDIYNPHLVSLCVGFRCLKMAVQKAIQSNKKQKEDRKMLIPAVARACVEFLDERALERPEIQKNLQAFF